MDEEGFLTQCMWKLTNFSLPQVRGFQLEDIGLQKPDMYVHYEQFPGNYTKCTLSSETHHPQHLLHCPQTH